MFTLMLLLVVHLLLCQTILYVLSSLLPLLFYLLMFYTPLIRILLLLLLILNFQTNLLHFILCTHLGNLNIFLGILLILRNVVGRMLHSLL